MYIAGDSFLNLPQIMFMSTWVIIPIRIPLEIEYVSGIIIIHTNAGIDSEKSSKLTFFICSAISNPTMIKAGAVAADGIERNSGEKNIAITKQHPTTRAVSPERPPWVTPAALST